jgi:phosphatidylserine/phosphatidylglycerophosphate/cardiolipin synthase-like enzyme
MGNISISRAYANNEVAYVAWDIDGPISGCLGFEVTRIYLNSDGSDLLVNGQPQRRRCPAWVAFKGQRNPLWLPQDSGIWPIQKMSWRDLTLRKHRDGMGRRPDEVLVRYEIRPVGDIAVGMEPAPDPRPRLVKRPKKDRHGNIVIDAAGDPVLVDVKSYEGTPRPLGYLGPAISTNAIQITRHRAPFISSFTNGLLSAQWLRNVLLEDDRIEADELLDKISTPGDPHRNYLAGDVLPMLNALFARPGTFYLGLYELEDRELQDLLLANATRIHVILSNTSADTQGVWDSRNAEARQELIDAGVDIRHRMFNNSAHIGHNKFAVHIDPSGTPQAVFTGSTNWTSTGLAGQTNNALVIEDPRVAQAFKTYWDNMEGDALQLPNPLSAPMNDNQQGQPFRQANASSKEFALDGGGSLKLWFSPNTKQRRKTAIVPPDLAEVYRLMRRAKDAILFLAFYPGQQGNDCIISEAVDIGRKDRKLIVAGAVSSANAMPNFIPSKEENGVKIKAVSPALFRDANVDLVRASRIDDRSLLGDFGAEQLTAKGIVGAIIHDKVLVIDPLSDDCVVVLGSHNLGFKASYSNDENMAIIQGHRAIAEAYAVHVLDVYDHYRFRAIQSELTRAGKKGWSGFLEIDDRWQDGYAARRKGALMRYFAR